MIVTTTWTGGRKFTAKGDSGYDIKMDATPAYGGMGEGATPTEMLLASLAGCIGIDVTMVLNHFLDKITKIEFITDGTRKERAAQRLHRHPHHACCGRGHRCEKSLARNRPERREVLQRLRFLERKDNL